MPGRRGRPKKAIGNHRYLIVRVESHEACLTAEVSHDAYHPEHAYRDGSEELLFQYRTRLFLRGKCLQPKEIEGDAVELTIYGDDSKSHRHDVTLSDIQEKDEKYRINQYRTYRDKEIPIYRPPKGMALFSKVRGENLWTAWLFTPTRFTGELLQLLGHGRDIFLELHEYKEARDRWLRGISVRTDMPDSW